MLQSFTRRCGGALGALALVFGFVGAGIGVTSGVASAVPASISAVGALASNNGTGLTTLSVNPQSAGDGLVFFAKVYASLTVSSVSGGGVTTWTKAVAYNANGREVEIWFGTVTSTGPSTITVNWSGDISSANPEYSAQEFSSGLGASTTWAVDGNQTGTLNNPSSTSVPLPSLSPSGSGELYLGFAWVGNTGSSGSTPNFTYAITIAHDVVAYDADVSAPVSPAASQSPAGTSTAVAVLLEATSALVPTVTGVSPSQGSNAGGTSVSITGTNFTGATAVTFGSVAAGGFTVNSDTSITATSPAEPNGQVDVTVTGTAGTSVTSPADQFTFVAPGTISAVGGFVMGYGTGLITQAVSPQNVGDVIVLHAKVAGTGTLPKVSSVSGGGVSAWNKAVSFGFNQHEEEIWYGTVTSTGPSTITVNWSGSVAALGTEYNAQEFTADLGASTVWVVDGSQTGTLTNPSSSTVAFPTLTPSTSGDVYFGYGQCASDCGAGSTPGFTYGVTWDYNVVTYDPNVTSAVSPTAPQSPANYSWSLAVLLEPSTSITVPDAPTGLGATAGNTTAALSWSAPSSNGGSAVTGYNVYEGTSPGAEAGTPVNASLITGTTYTVTGLTNGTTYYFTVEAVNPAGSSASSNEASATPALVPTVTGVSPSQGSNAGGTSVSITGTNFTGATAVTFGSVAAGGFTVNSDTSITATSPAEPNGQVDVTVTGTAGTSVTSPADQFTFVAPGTISAVGGFVMGYGTGLITQAVSPQNVGDVIVLHAKVAGTGTLPKVSSVSGGGVSAWNKAVSFGFNQHEEEIWYGTVTSTGPSTITVNWSGSVAALGTEYNAQEFTADLGASTVWVVDGSQTGTLTNPSSSTVAFPTLTPSTSGDVYFGYGQCASDCGAGSTPGFTYGVTWDYNVVTYDPNVTSAVSPTAPQSPANYSWSLAVLLEPSTSITVPDAPTGLGATAGNTTAALSWSAPSSNGGSAVTGYNVYEGTSPGAEAGTPVNASLITGTTYTVTGLTNGTTYYFTVEAVNPAGSSASSNEASATPATVPGAPTGLGAIRGNTTVALSWKAPSSNGGSAITGYNVYEGTRSGHESTTPVNGSTLITGTSYTVTGLTNGTTYYFTVKAVNAVGSSAASNEASATPATVPGAPTGLGATRGNTTVALSWKAPSSNGGSAITGYNVYEGTSPGAEAGTPVNTSPITGTSYTVRGLTNGTTYYFTVEAVNAVGSSASSNEASATPATVPGAPTGLGAIRGNTTVALSWSAPSSNGGSAITGYNVYEGTRSGHESTTPVNGSTLITGTSYTVKGLTNGTTYYFTVKAVNAAGSSAASNEASATPATVPGAPTGLGATRGNTTVALSWKVPLSNGGSAITGYNVYEGTTSGGESTTPVNGGTLITGTSYTVKGLTNGTTYYFTVKAVNAAGSSAASNQASATP
ncbi:MAG: fibronectin type III domain-containing protein [Acidimicrobiales bacterium]